MWRLPPLARGCTGGPAAGDTLLSQGKEKEKRWEAPCSPSVITPRPWTKQTPSSEDNHPDQLQQHVREISTILKLTFMQILFYQTSADVKFFIKVILNKISTSTQPSLPSNQFLQFQVNICCCRGPAASLSQLLILCRNKLSSTGKFDTLTPGGAELGWAGQSQYFKPSSNHVFITGE